MKQKKPKNKITVTYDMIDSVYTLKLFQNNRIIAENVFTDIRSLFNEISRLTKTKISWHIK